MVVILAEHLEMALVNSELIAVVFFLYDMTDKSGVRFPIILSSESSLWIFGNTPWIVGQSVARTRHAHYNTNTDKCSVHPCLKWDSNPTHNHIVQEV